MGIGLVGGVILAVTVLLLVGIGGCVLTIGGCASILSMVATNTPTNATVSSWAEVGPEPAGGVVDLNTPSKSWQAAANAVRDGTLERAADVLTRISREWPDSPEAGIIRSNLFRLRSPGAIGDVSPSEARAIVGTAHPSDPAR